MFSRKDNDGKEKHVNLWYDEGHFDSIINIKAFYGSKHYCNFFDKAYENIDDHYYENGFYICLNQFCNKDVPVRCLDCDRLCRSQEYFELGESRPKRGRRVKWGHSVSH